MARQCSPLAADCSAPKHGASRNMGRFPCPICVRSFSGAVAPPLRVPSLFLWPDAPGSVVMHLSICWKWKLSSVAQDFRSRVLPVAGVPQRQQKGTFKSQQEDCPAKPLQAALERLSRWLGDSAAHGTGGLAELSVCGNQAGTFYLDNSSGKASWRLPRHLCHHNPFWPSSLGYCP